MHLSLQGAAMDALVKHLSPYSNNDLIERWKALEGRLNNAESIVVANAGLFKAGKSSLFNALFESIETERFPTGAAPVTHTLDRQEWVDGILLIDTPGIGTDGMDEEQARSSYRMADIILFVHNMRMGDYQRDECDFIAKIRDEIGAFSNIRERFLFVGSRLDEIQGTSDENEIRQRMSKQLTQIFGFEMPIYVESATRYMKGAREKKGGLINASGFAELRVEILRRATAARLFKNESLSRELDALKLGTVAVLSRVHEEQRNDIQRIKVPVDAKSKDVVSSLNKFFDNYRGRLNIILRKQSQC